jgi:hypothetical protein
MPFSVPEIDDFKSRVTTLLRVVCTTIRAGRFRARNFYHALQIDRYMDFLLPALLIGGRVFMSQEAQ